MGLSVPFEMIAVGESREERQLLVCPSLEVGCDEGAINLSLSYLRWSCFEKENLHPFACCENRHVAFGESVQCMVYKVPRFGLSSLGREVIPSSRLRSGQG